ncbi:putative nicastrin, nicalin, EF-Hand 1, calcium-binding protein [Arabidopsis thaliana]
MAEEKKSKQRHRVMVFESMYPILALMLILVACVELCDAATVVDVYRLIQYDISGVPFGSRFSSLNHHAASLSFQRGADLSRSVLILPLRELDIAFVQDYISQKQSLGGLLILLPQTFRPGNVGGGSLSSENDGFRSLLGQLEKLLVHGNVPFPVYFAFENEETDAMLADVKKNDALGQQATATTGGYKLVISVSEPRKIASPTITNIQGWLPGLRAEGDSSQLPTIAVVASYDTFGAAPALSVGSDSNGSGVVALLEVARLFSVLYSNPKTRGKYNLLFALTSGGPYNYEGTQKWLKSLDQRMRESIDYAICLNSVGSWDSELLIHGFSNVAEDLGFQVALKHKKINISNSRVAWEHEQFSRLRVTAATISELSTPPELLENAGSLSDTRQLVNEDAIIKGVKLVAESLAKHIYGHQGKEIKIFADDSSLAVNPFYVRSWLDLLSQTPRVAPFLSKNEPLIMALKKELEDYTAEVSVQHESLDGSFTFYDSTKASLNIYQVASVTFDLLLLLVLGSYLIVLFSFLVITTRGLDDLISLFRRPPSRKVKMG